MLDESTSYRQCYSVNCELFALYSCIMLKKLLAFQFFAPGLNYKGLNFWYLIADSPISTSKRNGEIPSMEKLANIFYMAIYAKIVPAIESVPPFSILRIFVLGICGEKFLHASALIGMRC